MPIFFVPHSDLNQSVMNDRDYMNRRTFLEAELAMLEDIGWIIDRRNFFGYSLYRDGQSIKNTRGYFARNAEGTGYLEDHYNQEPDGMGLHIYGSYNTVTQAAPILTEGSRAVGIRVDGIGNTLIIDPQTKIHANGSNGLGILFAYGKDHHLIMQGEVKAEGEHGRALSFDFGGNLLGTEAQQRGSSVAGLLSSYSELNGPLVKSVSIDGALSAGYQAIYMSSSGFVEKITISPDAKIMGDIISEFNYQAIAYVMLRYSGGIKHMSFSEPSYSGLINAPSSTGITTLIFGSDAGTLQKPDRKFIYTHNIQGSNIAAQFTGGYTALYNGQHKLHRAAITPGATLAGNSTFHIMGYGNHNIFLNEGILSPSSSEELLGPTSHIGEITIRGTFEQTSSGKLIIDITKDGASDSLLVTEKARLAGTLELRPEQTFYPNDWSQTVTFLEAADGIEGDFETISSQSPTLEWKTLSSKTAYRASGKKIPQAQKEEPSIFQYLNSMAKTLPQEGENQNFNLSNFESETRISSEEAQLSQSITLQVRRKEDAYSQYASDPNRQALGFIFPALAVKASEDSALRSFYTALDFSALDGSQIRTALSQITPASYSAIYGANIGCEQQISDMLNALPFPSQESIPPWQIFALPFGERTQQNSSEALFVPYKTTQRGLIFGGEHHPSPVSHWLWGIHGIFNQGHLSITSPDSAYVQNTGGDLGLHMRYEDTPLKASFFRSSPG